LARARVNTLEYTLHFSVHGLKEPQIALTRAYHTLNRTLLPFTNTILPRYRAFRPSLSLMNRRRRPPSQPLLEILSIDPEP